jgi:hypothetical protein
MPHPPRERRRRRVYITRNTEYHVLDDVCVAVRDRATGRWRADHAALSRRLEGGVRIFTNGAIVPSLRPARVGEPMYFALGGFDDCQVVTSRLEAVGRPALEDLEHYRAA